MGRLTSACLLLFLPLICLSKAVPELKSTVRILEGVVAPDWEERFLPPAEPSATLTTPRESADADILNTTPPLPRKTRAVTPVKNDRRPVADLIRPDPEAEPSPSPRQEDAPRSRAVEKIVKGAVAPAHHERTRQTTVPPVSKIDKEEETGDDSIEKRKKERRDTLREERKDRNYRNRRIE
ncbi:MAG TPA: hypothetical protein PKH10_07015 [bacterium]|nr:hypothetical protein [bacterium]